MQVALTVPTSWTGPRSSTATGWRSSTSPALPGRSGASPTPRWRRGRAAWRCALDDLGVGLGERVAIVSPNAARFLSRFFGVSGFGRVLVPDQLPADRRRGRVHRRALRRVVLLSTPSSTTRVAASRSAHRICSTASTTPRCSRRRPRRTPGRWEPDEDATCSINYTSGTTARPEGRAAHPPQLLAQRGHFRLAHGRQRPRRAPAHPADVPLQRLGHAVRGDGHGRPPRRAAQGRRRGDPARIEADGRHAPLRRAGRRGRHPRRGRGARRREGEAGARPGPVRIVVAGAPPPRRPSSGSRPSSAGSSSRSTG